MDMVKTVNRLTGDMRCGGQPFAVFGIIGLIKSKLDGVAGMDNFRMVTADTLSIQINVRPHAGEFLQIFLGGSHQKNHLLIMICFT